MLPKIFRALLTAGGKTPYTFDWEWKTEPVSMEVNPAMGTVGPLRFGDSIDAARVFGRPDEYRHLEGSGCGLCYYRRGFYLEFDSARRFSFCNFFLSPDTPPMSKAINYTSVSIRPGRVIAGQTRVSDLVSLLGRPFQSPGSDGSLVTFALHSLTLDFHINAEGRLVDLDVFPVENLQTSRG